MAAFPILLGAVGANYCITVGGHVSTDDAFVRAAKESVNARVTRKWWKLPVKNNERVKKGQLLFRLDPEPFQIAIERADAALDGARLQIDALKAT
jgi:membrane fusion protein (multidrug efflux system)